MLPLLTESIINFQSCPTSTFDIGPGILQVLLQVVTIASIAVGASRIQSAVQGQQAVRATQAEEEKKT